MSYYILPKIMNIVIVNPICSNKTYTSYLSHSILNYYKEMCREITTSCEYDADMSYNKIDHLIKIVNPYEYIFSQVPSTKFSVSKLKQKTNLFYDLLELSTTLNIFDMYKLDTLETLHLTSNNTDTVQCLEMARENYNDKITCYDGGITKETIKLIGDKEFHFLFLETRTEQLNNYIISFVEILMIILRNQITRGSCLIKISDTFHKPIVDILYLLSSLYEKTYILKPNTSNITTFEKYIFCKNFIHKKEENMNLKNNYFILLLFLKQIRQMQQDISFENITVESIVDYDIPYNFIMKLNDMNISIGQQQLEALDLIINILKKKNKEEKIETMQKSNIQKCILWCEKYKIPCNKFSEKTNIFLHAQKGADE